MVLVDANYIIRFFSKEPDEHYQKSKEFFEDLARGKVKVIISEGVLMECFFILNKFYKYPRNEVIDMLTTIMNFKNVVNEDKHIILTTLSILKDKNIDFIDALLCAKSKLLGYEVKSFEKDLKKCLKN
jgi:predicted nucleic-acid-binding protein